MATGGIILPHHGKNPSIIEPAYVAPNAVIVGEVTTGKDCSFWFNSVTRGDVNSIEIGEATNIQDLSILHVTYKKAALKIGHHVSIGHRCVIHGCTLGNRVLVGMGSIIMDGAVIENDVLIGADTLITEGMHIPSGSLVVGKPGKVKRKLSPEEIAGLLKIAIRYTHVGRSYTGGPWVDMPV